MTSLEGLLTVLTRSRVRFIIVGGVAATIHGSSRLTADLDIIYQRSEVNIERLVKALTPLSPTLRGAPAGLPFRLDTRTVRAGLNFTLQTALGALDLLGEIAGGFRYETLQGHYDVFVLFDHRCNVLDLETLIAAKRAAGRPRDFETIAELELIRLEREGKS